MVKWKILYTKRAQEDALELKKCGFQKTILALIDLIAENPYKNPPSFEKLFGLENTYSRRINIRHRLVYEINKKLKTIIVRMMFKHYGD